jgi:HEAT repeat protein
MHSSQITIRLELLIWIAAGLLALAFGVAGCGSDEAGEPSPPPSAAEPIPMEPPASAAVEPDEAAEDADLAAVAEALKSSDPEERSAALFDLEPEGRGLQVLLEVLSDDPDPAVRGLAARQLGYAKSPEATAGLVSALDDPDPGVLIEAIDALELTGDSAVTGSLEKLLQHPDAQVREAAKDAIEFLKD